MPSSRRPPQASRVCYIKPLYMILSVRILKLGVSRGQAAFHSLLNQTTERFSVTMSSRRSARLSAASPVQAAPQVNGTITEAANVKKRKVSESKNANRTSKEAVPIAPKPPRAKKAVSTTDAMPPPPVPPATPQNKRRRKGNDTASPTKAPPLTPTPSAVGIIASGKPPPALPTTPSQVTAARPRPAEPHATNAPLSTPGGSKVFAYPPNDAISSSPLKASLMLPRTTTDTLLEEACAHLVKVDPNLETLVKAHHCKLFSPTGLQEEIEPFRSLVSSIMAQQVPHH